MTQAATHLLNPYAEAEARAAAQQDATEELATEEQRDYLTQLVQDDPGTAGTYGVARWVVKGVPAELTKKNAERLIKELTS